METSKTTEGATIEVPVEELSERDKFYAWLSDKSPEEQERVLSKLTKDELWRLNNDWEMLARPKQLPPEKDFAVWLIRAGRGWG